MEWFESGDLDQLTDGGWVTAVAAAMLSCGLACGLVTWLKGRKLLAVLVWVLLAGVTGSLAAFSLGAVEPTAANKTTLTSVIAIATAVGLTAGVVGAIRLAKPSSWWAQRIYTNDQYTTSMERYGWSKVRPR
jgi:hypothetical protein